MRKSIKEDIAELLAKREKLRAQEFKMRMERRNTRARVTTMNAKIGQVNDEVYRLRELDKIKK